MSSEIPLCLLARVLGADCKRLPTELQNEVWSFLPRRPFTSYELRHAGLNLNKVDNWPGQYTDYDFDRRYYLNRLFYEAWNDSSVHRIAGLPKLPVMTSTWVSQEGVEGYCHYTVYFPNTSQVYAPAKGKYWQWPRGYKRYDVYEGTVTVVGVDDLLCSSSFRLPPSLFPPT